MHCVPFLKGPKVSALHRLGLLLLLVGWAGCATPERPASLYPPASEWMLNTPPVRYAE